MGMSLDRDNDTRGHAWAALRLDLSAAAPTVSLTVDHDCSAFSGSRSVGGYSPYSPPGGRAN
eukprot:4241678-Pyramimonas_sp.AAC.1